jgi:Fur family ferric uptake transcriptional regulator
MNLISHLKENRYRVTTSREIICNILEKAGHEHFTADSLFQLARKQSKDIDLATIYRTFELLEELDIIEHSHQAHSSGLYYLKNQQTNTHIACESCSNIEDISDKTMSKVNELIAKDSGYKIEKNHFVYSGKCKKCK